jgi:hypothetical protein
MRAPPMLGGALLDLLGTACQPGSSSGPTGDPHASPEAAARSSYRKDGTWYVVDPD